MRKYLFLLLLVFSGQSSAAYTYYVWVMPHFSKVGASPGSLCAQFSDLSGSWVYTSASKTQAQCVGDNGDPIATTNMNREGTICQADKVWDQTEGTCLCPVGTGWNATTNQCADSEISRCQALQGQQTYATTTGNTNDPNATVGRAGSTYYNRSRNYNVGGCKVDVGLGGTGGKCVFKPDGIYACRFPVGYTGELANSESAMDETPPDPVPQKTSDSDQECSAWADGGNGTRSKNCTSTSTASEDGSSTCERGDYNMDCYKPMPTPESDTNTRDDDITETSNSDGGKTTTTDSTATNTHCLDGSCNSSTTKISTTTITNGNGEVTGETTTCTGADCADPGGNGEGEGSGEEESFASPGGGEFGSVSDALPVIGEDGDKTYAQATQEYIDRIKASPIVSSVLNISVPSGGSCSIGSASLFGGTISFNDFCSMAPNVLSDLRYLFLAIWAWAAIRLLMTA